MYIVVREWYQNLDQAENAKINIYQIIMYPSLKLQV